MKLLISIATFSVLATSILEAAPAVKIRLPERFRLLTEQRFDLRVEAINLASVSSANVKILIDGKDATASFPAPEVSSDNDADPENLDKAWTFRAFSFDQAGAHTVTAQVTDDGGTSSSAVQKIGVQKFQLAKKGARKNFILFIGDAMGTTYRDSGRIVAKSAGNHFREGFFDQLQAMDTMPVSGMVMTYALDRVVPDSANTATAWASGNKTVDGTLNVFPDNNDFKVNTSAGTLQSTKQFALDNPRVETLWEYLKRRYNYKTGIVTTADVTDATPGGEGGHSLLRALTFDIARQYTDGVFTDGPTFDVILGGGREHFDLRSTVNSGDTRNLITELTGLGFTSVGSRTALKALPTGSSAPDKLLGLFYSQGGSDNQSAISNTGANGNMNVAYDKLGLVRPGDEPAPNFNGFTDQPFLHEMTSAAIATLSKGGSPFILMVEGASIDKQSHPNHAAGVIWDVIEFDQAVNVGRTFAAGTGKQPNKKTLVCVSADHDQSMHIVGITDTAVEGSVTNTRGNSVYPRTITPYDPASHTLAPSNAGNNVGEVTGFPNYADANNDGFPENTNEFQIAVGFRTGNHTGSSVPITAEGPGALLFTGYFDQTDIFFKAARVLSTDTAPLDTLLKKKDLLGTVSQNYGQ